MKIRNKCSMSPINSLVISFPVIKHKYCSNVYWDRFTIQHCEDIVCDITTQQRLSFEFGIGMYPTKPHPSAHLTVVLGNDTSGFKFIDYLKGPFIKQREMTKNGLLSRENRVEWRTTFLYYGFCSFYSSKEGLFFSVEFYLKVMLHYRNTWQK